MVRRVVRSFLTLVVVAWIVPLRAQAPSQQGKVVTPDTPAGRVLAAWLDAFNSGDSTRMDAYLKTYEPSKSLENQLAFRKQTGGFDLVSLEKSDPLHLEYIVKEKNRGISAFGALELTSGAPATVKTSALLAIPPGASAAAFRIDAATRARVIDGAATQLEESYVFPAVAKAMEDSVRARLGRGEYDSITNGMVFASRLTDDFQAVSHDKHLRVNFSPAHLPNAPPQPSPDAQAQMRRQMERINCAFVKIEQLPGNIGYLKFNGFMNPDVCGPTAAAAMNFLANVDALVIDLRDNGGGDPRMVAYLCSYLFSHRTHLNDLWTRKTNTTQEFWTLDSVPGKRLADSTPVYLLTSSLTFSGAEEFSYNLKNLKRATVVGETTGGGAHPVSGHRVDDHFMIGVPFAKAVNPITKTNWEGVGVEPDVKVPAADALATALKLAEQRAASK